MKYIAKTYEEFLNEWDSAMPFNTPGMGNVVSSGDVTTFADEFYNGHELYSDPNLVIEDDSTDAWMRPSGDYSNRNWLMPNYTQYMKLQQSNARFQIGERVVCVDPNMGCYGKTGKIIAFEDNTIRFEVLNSETGVGQIAKQYRCLASCLKKI